MAVLQEALEEESLLGLRQAAARTPMMQDDVIVARIGHAAAERASLEPQLAGRRAEGKAAAERVQQLLALRREMRERRVETSRWNFGDGALLGMLLGQVLGGSLSRGGFWDRVEESRVPGNGPWGQGLGCRTLGCRTLGCRTLGRGDGQRLLGRKLRRRRRLQHRRRLRRRRRQFPHRRFVLKRATPPPTAWRPPRGSVRRNEASLAGLHARNSAGRRSGRFTGRKRQQRRAACRAACKAIALQSACFTRGDVNEVSTDGPPTPGA
jgi:hypothetical protein